MTTLAALGVLTAAAAGYEIHRLTTTYPMSPPAAYHLTPHLPSTVGKVVGLEYVYAYIPLRHNPQAHTPTACPAATVEEVSKPYYPFADAPPTPPSTPIPSPWELLGSSPDQCSPDNLGVAGTSPTLRPRRGRGTPPTPALAALLASYHGIWTIRIENAAYRAAGVASSCSFGRVLDRSPMSVVMRNPATGGTKENFIQGVQELACVPAPGGVLVSYGASFLDMDLGPVLWAVHRLYMRFLMDRAVAGFEREMAQRGMGQL